MKIAYLSVSPLISSGYGRCCKEVVYGLLKEHAVDVFAYYGLQQTTIDITLDGDEGDGDVRIIGGNGTIYHPVLPQVQDKYDVIIAHFDLWMATFNPAWLDQITTPVVWWAIVDHEPLPHPVRRLLRHPCLYKAVPMTIWAMRCLEEYCKRDLTTEIITAPIPHGVDIKTFYPDDNDSFPADAEFKVISVVANHGPRENIPTMIEGFARFLKNTDADAVYYIHTDPVRAGGYNLFEVVKSIEELYGIDLTNRILFKSGDMVPDEMLREYYSAADCQLMTVMGGSFEMPVVEAGACETPSIVGNFSAPAELVGVHTCCRCRKVVEGERGLAVTPSAYQWMNLSSARQAQYHPMDIAKALEMYYYNPRLAKKHGIAMRQHVQENLTWDRVRMDWLDLMRKVEEELL